MKDQFGRALSYLRLSVVDRCNLRCLYCMPAGGADFDPWGELMSYEEILSLVKIFADLGVTKVRITGGEPLVRRGLEELIFRLKEIPQIQELALSTNAVFLKDRARNLKLAGLDRINISLDTLDRDRFIQISKMDRLTDVLDGIDAALGAGIRPVKLNTVLLKGINDAEVLSLVRFAVEKSLEVRFIELMPTHRDVQINAAERFYSCDAAREQIVKEYELVPVDTYFSSPARVFEVKGTQARVGFISPLSCQFCVRCNRVRLKANGALKTCLHGPEDLNLRDLLRQGIPQETIKQRIEDAVWRRPEQHFLNEAEVKHRDFQMSHVGG